MTLRVLWEDFNIKSKAELQQVYTLPILAQRLNVNINDYTQADTFDCEIDYKTFPFDPRLVRACGVTIHMEDRKRIFKDDNTLNLIEPTPENTIFQGFVDEETVQLSEDSRSVRFEGRDFTALLIDTPLIRKTPLDVSQPLDKVLQTLLSEVKSVQEIKIDNRTGQDLPILKSYYQGFGEPLAGHKNLKDRDTYWEVIQDLVVKAGLIAFIELDKLVIATPRTVYNKAAAVRFIYGRNLNSLEFKRKLGRQKGFNVAVRSLNLSSKEVLISKIPIEASPDFVAKTGIPAKEITIPQVSPNGEKGEDKPAPYITFRVADVASKAALTTIAENIFEEMSRQQLDGSLSTRDMCAYTDGGNGVNPAEFDLLKLRIGSPLRLSIDQGDMKGLEEINRKFEKPELNEADIAARTGEITKFLNARCYDPKVSKVIAETFGKTSPYFYTKSVHYTLEKDAGFSLKCDFVNFIDIQNKGLA